MQKDMTPVDLVPSLPMFRRLLCAVRPQWGLLAAAVLVNVVVAAVSGAMNVLLSGAVNTAFAQKSVFTAEMGLYLSVVALSIPSGTLSVWLSGRFDERASEGLRSLLAGQVLRVRVETMDTKNTGDFVARFTGSLGAVQVFLQENMLEITVIMFSFIAAIVSCVLLSWQLTLIAFALVPVLMGMNVLRAKPTYTIEREIAECSGEALQVVQEALAAPELVKSFTLEQTLFGRYSEILSRQLGLHIRNFRVFSLLWGGSMAVSMLPQLVLSLVGGLMVVQGTLSIGALAAFIIASHQIMGPICGFGHFVTTFNQAMGQEARVFEVADMPQERLAGEATPAGEAAETDAMLAFRGVGFAYPGKEPLFDDLGFSVRRGETVALAGPSGCGKSTVFQLIAGFYDAQSGAVEIAGRPVGEWELDAVRRLMAVVTQDTYLFPGTLGENVRCGRPGATDGELREAVRAAGLASFVDTLADGLETQVGERGVNLSGGQRQRVAIARALLKDAPILMLDEPTSSLDYATERELQAELERLMRGRTTLIIAHRLTTIRGVDRILCMQGGRIVESGTHDELMGAGGLYRQLYEKQLRGGGEER